jgi:peptidoglycan hydrolase-like protein with peptidoglycan-binding domain
MRCLPIGLKATLALGALAATLAGCAQAPTGPSVQAVPGPRKSFAEFQQDNSYCMAYATTQLGDAQKQANQQQAIATVGTMVLGAAVGALTGQNSYDTSYGAGTGLAAGAAVGADGAANATATMQQRYDNSFVQCMFAKGESVPGLTPAVSSYASQGRSASDPMVRAIQAELVRTGFLGGGVDGSYGPATRSAILSFERANGLGADPSATSSLLAHLRSAPSASSGSLASVGNLVQPVTGPHGGASGGSGVVPVSSPGALPATGAPAGSGLVAPVTGGGLKNP